MSPEEYSSLASQVMEICRRYETTCVLHTFSDVALSLGADALHVPLPVLRQMDENERSSFRILGTSCHSIEDAAEAEDNETADASTGASESSDDSKETTAEVSEPAGIEETDADTGASESGSVDADDEAADATTGASEEE